MGLRKELDVDIARFLEQIENQSHSGKRETLKILLEKYIHLNTCDYILDHDDLRSIIGQAKVLFSSKVFPCFLGSKKRKVSQNDQPNLCVIEATISLLNNKDCFKKLPKFDYRENKL